MPSIRILCPVCKKVKVKEIPEEVTQRNGISSLLVLADDQCEHNLVAFVDNEHRVRRVEQLDYAPTGSSVIEVQALAGMTLRGLRRVLGDLMAQIIAGLLEKRTVVLCNDVDVGISTFGTINRIFIDGLELGRDVIVVDRCTLDSPNALVIDTQVPQKLAGTVGKDLTRVLDCYLDEALEVVDNEASIIIMRQKVHGLDKAAEAVEAVVSKRMPSREVMKKIKKSFGIKIDLDELRATIDILSGRGIANIKDLIIVSGLDDF